MQHRVVVRKSKKMRQLRRRALSAGSAAARKSTYPQLLRLKLPGPLSAWKAIGFAQNSDADDIALSLGGVEVGIGDCSSAPSSWGWRDGPSTRGPTDAPPPWWWETVASEGFTEVDVAGVPTAIDDLDADEHLALLDARAQASEPHPNGALGIYSVCVTTPDFDGTLTTLKESGLDLRRVRKASDPASPLSRGLSMAFFKFGAPPGRDVILEVVAPGTQEYGTHPSPAVALERAAFPVGARPRLRAWLLKFHRSRRWQSSWVLSC